MLDTDKKASSTGFHCDHHLVDTANSIFNSGVRKLEEEQELTTEDLIKEAQIDRMRRQLQFKAETERQEGMKKQRSKKKMAAPVDDSAVVDMDYSKPTGRIFEKGVYI